MSFASANFAEDYQNEFNLEGENCEIIDVFVYDVSNPSFFNSERKYTTFPVIYDCCNENNCNAIIFDGNHKTFINNFYLEEIIDLNYIRYNLHQGLLSENYFLIEGLDACSYFRFKDAKKQTLNLASEVVETGALAIGTERTYALAKTIKTARKIGVVGKFNPASLFAGVACGYDNKKLNLAIENLALLNAYLINLNNGYSQQSYVTNLTNSVSISKYYLNEYVSSPTAIVRGGVNFGLNSIKGLFKFSQNINEGLKIDKTEYQIAQETLNKVSSYNLYLSNPNKSIVVEESNLRMTQKINQFNESYSNFIKNYNEVNSLKIGSLQIFFTNLFYKPNYNLTEGNICFDDLRKNKKLSEKYYNELKFNSALKIINDLDNLFYCSKEVFLRERSIERKFDKFWIYFVLSMTFLYFLIKNNDEIIRKIDKFKI